MIRVLEARFVTSCANLNDAPSIVGAEIAILGRSNVGKSSLINALLNNKNLAKSSSTPGKTRLVNFYISQWRVEDLGGGRENFGDSRESKNSSLQCETEAIQWDSYESRESCKSNLCHFERSEKSNLKQSLQKKDLDSRESHNSNVITRNAKHFVAIQQDSSDYQNLGESKNFSELTPPPNPLPQGEVEFSDSFGLSPTYFFAKQKSKQKTLDLGNSRETKSFLPTFSKSRWGLGRSPAQLNISPSPKVKCVWRGQGSGVIPKKSTDSHESKNPIDCHNLTSLNLAIAKSATCQENSANAQFAEFVSESQKFFQLSPQNDKILDCYKSNSRNGSMRISHESPPQNPSTADANHKIPQKSEITIRILDFPGFGYAKVSKSEKSAWDRNLSAFLQKRESIKLFIHLIDSRHTNLALDNEIRAFLRTNLRGDADILEVFTKSDKLKKSEISALKRQNKICVSIANKASIAHLRSEILRAMYRGQK